LRRGQLFPATFGQVAFGVDRQQRAAAAFGDGLGDLLGVAVAAVKDDDDLALGRVPWV